LKLKYRPKLISKALANRTITLGGETEMENIGNDAFEHKDTNERASKVCSILQERNIGTIYNQLREINKIARSKYTNDEGEECFYK